MAFARLRSSRAAEPISAINMTPLIDVMLVLLVIFIVTAPLVVSGLRLDLPTAEGAQPAEPTTVLAVAVDAQGQLYLDEQPVAPEALRARAQAAAARDPATEVQLRADGRVPYARVAELIGWMQQAGLNRIGFVTAAEGTPAPGGR
jgi:biopolymer transport protein ExbD